MKWLLVSDLHYRLRQYDWVEQVASSFDIVIIAGDLLDVRSAVPIAAQTVAVSAQVARIGVQGTVAAASGNHDLDARDIAGEKHASWLQRVGGPAVFVDGSSLVVGDTLVTVCPWWDGPAGRDALEQRLAAEPASEHARWAWVYHSPPTGSALSWDGRRSFGDDALAAWIRRFGPDFVFTGHIHQAPFADGGGWAELIGRTWVFNAGQEPGPVPAHIVVDLDAERATWYSSEGSETVALDGLAARGA